MARSVHIFVGDKVETPNGLGYVERVTTWRDRVIEMSDYEAKEFSQSCKTEAGLDYRETWAQVMVRIGKRRSVFFAHQIKVKEGRDVEPREFGKVT